MHSLKSIKLIVQVTNAIGKIIAEVPWPYTIESNTPCIKDSVDVNMSSNYLM